MHHHHRRRRSGEFPGLLLKLWVEPPRKVFLVDTDEGKELNKKLFFVFSQRKHPILHDNTPWFPTLCGLFADISLYKKLFVDEVLIFLIAKFVLDYVPVSGSVLVSPHHFVMRRKGFSGKVVWTVDHPLFIVRLHCCCVHFQFLDFHSQITTPLQHSQFFLYPWTSNPRHFPFIGSISDLSRKHRDEVERSLQCLQDLDCEEKLDPVEVLVAS